MRKGIFWVVDNSNAESIIAINVECDISGNTLDDTVEFSSKSGESFNHKIEWNKLPHSITHGKEFNYYPRGRVEIKNGVIRIFINPDAYNEETFKTILKDFELEKYYDIIRVIIDNSSHYQYSQEKL